MRACQIAADMVLSQRNLQTALVLGRHARTQRESAGVAATRSEVHAGFVALSQQMELRRLGALLAAMPAANDAPVTTEPEPTAA